jgi:hypothetical protein
MNCNKAVALDFDRTITQNEGFLSVSYEIPLEQHGWCGFKKIIANFFKGIDLDDITIDGWVEYYMGGKIRMDEIMSFIDLIYNLNSELIILTNNRSMLFNPELIYDFVSVLTRERPFRIVASCTYPNKPSALSDLDRFSDICRKDVKPFNYFLDSEIISIASS